MKRMHLVSLAIGLCVISGGTVARGQDAATEERLNQLSGRLETFLEHQEAQQKQISELIREVNSLRDAVNKPAPPPGASQEDLKRLADSVREVDRKRLDDYEKIRTELQKLGHMLKESAPAVPKASQSTTKESTKEKETKPAVPDSYYEYEVQKNDTLSAILQAYREKGIKVTTEQVLKANPGLKPERMRVGQKIIIPAAGAKS